MKPQIIIVLASLVALLQVQADDGATPPKMWEVAFRDEHQAVWDRLRKGDGKVTASEVIEENYKGGSHHDGDRQLATAFSLIQLPDDPIPALRKMMLEKKPERRAFAVLVAGILGDTRLVADVDRLGGDNAILGQFSGDWFWDTVSDAAKEAARSLGEGSLATKMGKAGTPVSHWLKSTKPNAEQGGAGQPATALESKSENKEKPKPESEGRSQ